MEKFRAELRDGKWVVVDTADGSVVKSFAEESEAKSFAKDKNEKYQPSVKDLISHMDKMNTRLVEAEKKKAEYEDVIEKSLVGGSRGQGSADSEERKCLRMFGCKDLKELMETNVADPTRFRHVPDEWKHYAMGVKKTLDTARFTAQIVHGIADRHVRKNDKTDGLMTKVPIYDTYYGKNVLTPMLKAFGTGTATEGAEWVPIGVSANFIEEYELERQVASAFRSVTMPTNAWDLPVATSTTTGRIQTEGQTNFTQTNPNTDKLRFSATKLAEFTVVPEELNEDSAPNILAFSRDNVLQAVDRAIETAILNGDTAGTHQDSDTTDADDARKAWDGLRKLALANSATTDFGNAAVTTTNLRAMRVAMGKYGVFPRELAWIVSSKVYNQMLDLDEVSTVEKFGNMATILRGALAALDGIPIIISEFARDDLNASGVEDGVTTDRSVVHLVNHTRAMMGIRRPLRVRAVMDPSIPNDRWLLCSWWRGDFQAHAQDGGEASIQLGIDVA